MRRPVVIIGIGEMAGVFARGFLRCGYPVYPITRDIEMAEEARRLPEPEVVLVAVGENSLQQLLPQIPKPWRDRLALLQNELLPRSWQACDVERPTVVSVWFEKKRGHDVKVLIPSPIHGPHAQLLADALESLSIPSRLVNSAEEMLFELVRKNLYIITTNVAGLEVGGTVAELWRQHEPLTRQIAHEVIEIQQWLTQGSLPSVKLMEGMLDAFAGDPSHKCMGRSAPERLERAIQQAADANLAVPVLTRIAAKHLKKTIQLT